MKLVEFLNIGRVDRVHNNDILNPIVICKDGYEISVQCSDEHYCSPKQFFYNCEMYESFDLWESDDYDILLDDYRDEYGDEMCFVPLKVVELLIEKHGGIVNS